MILYWNFEGSAIVPDAWGAIFSGSCVVDHNNTAGFGKDAVIAFLTSELFLGFILLFFIYT